MNVNGQTGLWVLLGIIIVVLLGAIFWKGHPLSSPLNGSTTSTDALFLCADDKTIDAIFKTGDSTPVPKPGEPPTPTGSVSLQLSDGRMLELPQTISASGVRYANGDESIIFWNKGNTAFLQEGTNQTYVNCIEAKGDPGGLPEAYADRNYEFTLRYPEGYSVNPGYKDQALGPGKDIPGVSFTIPKSLSDGTNLGSDTHFAIEQSSATSCSASSFFSDKRNPITLTENDTTYSVASTTDAGAGNRYEEWVYAIPGTSPCMAIRYFIHYSVIENYPPGAVKEFDKETLLAQFDAMRKTLIIGK